MSHTVSIPHTLTIAGSDPSGGAGLQGDLKTLSALGTYATNVITAVIAQNTCGVREVHPVAADSIRLQLDHLLDDVHLDAVKIGMVASREVAETLREALEARRPRWIVLDPVMVAKSGDILVDEAGISAVRDVLVPLADVITPNLPEAAVLVGVEPPTSADAMEAMLPALKQLSAPYVLLKGGHLDGDSCPDLLASPVVIAGCRRHASTPRTCTVPAAPCPRRSPPSWPTCPRTPTSRSSLTPSATPSAGCIRRSTPAVGCRWARDAARCITSTPGGSGSGGGRVVAGDGRP